MEQEQEQLSPPWSSIPMAQEPPPKKRRKTQQSSTKEKARAREEKARARKEQARIRKEEARARKEKEGEEYGKWKSQIYRLHQIDSGLPDYPISFVSPMVESMPSFWNEGGMPPLEERIHTFQQRRPPTTSREEDIEKNIFVKLSELNEMIEKGSTGSEEFEATKKNLKDLNDSHQFWSNSQEDELSCVSTSFLEFVLDFEMAQSKPQNPENYKADVLNVWKDYMSTYIFPYLMQAASILTTNEDKNRFQDEDHRLSSPSSGDGSGGASSVSSVSSVSAGVASPVAGSTLPPANPYFRTRKRWSSRTRKVSHGKTRAWNA